MIRSFRHKGLQHFFETGNTAGIAPEHAKRLRLILAVLDSMETLKYVHKSLDLHPLKGAFTDFYAVKVNKNWCLIFRFASGEVTETDYLDYH
jgi:proteic killer suppression protein